MAAAVETRPRPRDMLKRALAATIGRLRRKAIERYWSRAFAAGGVETWLAEPMVRRYVNGAVTGSPDTWPMEWLSSLYPAGFDRAVSLGCGDGLLERDLRRKRLCRWVVGIDLSCGALALAKDESRREGVSGVAYVRQDFNQLALRPRTLDAAFFHQALHHVEGLEGCLGEVACSLRAGGLLYLDEYVGPSRAEWRRHHLEEAEAIYRSLPRSVRRRRRLALPVDWRDPSEAIRSSDILSVLEARFVIELRRDYGGTFLSVIYPHLTLARISREERDDVLRTIVAAEQQHLAAGGASFYTVVIARPRSLEG
jgi:SAM-dependent methyltransferase